MTQYSFAGGDAVGGLPARTGHWLPIPKRFNRSSSKGFYRKNARGIAWFRDDALECISQMHEIKRVLEANGHVVQILREDRVGYTVYTDEAQVIAEPFADTRTEA